MSLIEIFNEDAYVNITVNNTIKNAKFNDYDKKLYTRLVYGVVEKKLMLDYLLQPHISGKRVKPYFKNALRVAVYGIDFLNIQNHYLVKEIVSTVKKKDYKASSFVNAILRKYIASDRRSLDNLKGSDLLSIKYSVNKDIVELLQKQYSGSIEDILSASKEGVNTYRINTLKTNLQEIKEALIDVEYTVEEDIILTTNKSLVDTTLFKEGKIIAQDKSSIMVGVVANALPNMKVLDACSAPGGKTMHMATSMKNEGKIVAIDVHKHKIKLIEENANKLGITCVKAKCADSSKVSFDEAFDLILADVPCSGLGVMHHKPDLKYHMTQDKINDIIKLQSSIVENVIKYLKKGGIFVYSTCTINKEENELFIEKFLKTHNNFKIEKVIKTLPSVKEDGFYICRLKEVSDE